MEYAEKSTGKGAIVSVPWNRIGKTTTIRLASLGSMKAQLKVP